MKRITAKIDEYQKDNQTKGKYVDIGVVLSNSNGEYILLNPTVDLSGVLMRQRILAQKNGKKVMDSVACSIFDNNNQGQPSAAPTNHPGQSGQASPQQPSGFNDSFDDDIPF